MGIKPYKSIYKGTVHFGRKRKEYFGYTDNNLFSLIFN